MSKLKQLVLAVLVAASGFCGEVVKFGSYNIENFNTKFDQWYMPERSRNMDEFYSDDEDLHEVALTILDKSFSPDIITIVECCSQKALDYFNEEYLGGVYEYRHVFKGNSDSQFVAVMAKKGFEPVEIEEDYYLEPDTEYMATKQNSDKEYKLFSRGPGFVLFKSPEGNKFWVGGTHSKSKSGNSNSVTQWRIREIKRTRDICLGLIKGGQTDKLVMMGDFNDDFGLDSYEKKLGEDAVAGMLCPQLDCLTLEYVKKHPDAASYHCYIKPPTYRSFLDQIFVSKSAGWKVLDTQMISMPIAIVASDHFPVAATIEFEDKGKE